MQEATSARALSWAVVSALGAGLALVFVLWAPWRQTAPLRVTRATITFSGPAALTLNGNGRDIALSPDGTLFAISRGHRVELHNLKAGTLVQTLTPDPPGDTGIYQITFSPKGDLLVGESSKRIIGWDVKTGQQKFLWSGHSNFITSVSFFPDGKRLASSSRDGTIRIWDLSRGPTDKILRTPQGWPQGVAISADGKVLVGGEGGGATVDGSIAVWDAETGNLKRRLRETYGGGNVVLSPDGKTVACRSPGGGGITFWDVDSGRARYRWEPKKSGPAAVALTPDGSTLAVVTQDGMVRVWDVKP